MEKILNPKHRDELHRSGLTDDTIRSLGLYSGTAEEVEGILGFHTGPGLIIPYPYTVGDEPFYRIKPDSPPIIDGKPAKYLSPRGAIVRAYTPPRTLEALKDPKAQVIITEGEKKAAKTDQEDFPCIGLGGVWSFYQNHRLIPDLVQQKWRDRPVVIAYDSDVAEKSEIKEAIFVLERELVALGANVKVIRFKPASDGSKTGLDDFLVAYGPTVLQELLKKARPSLEWEIEDIVQLPVEDRLQPFRHLFRKLSCLDAVELEPCRNLCLSQLKLPRRDFQAQLSKAKGYIENQRSIDKTTVEEIDQVADTVDPAVRQHALTLLEDPALLYQVGRTIQQRGIAGEDSNIRILYLAITSRITNQPISITAKGESSSGKSRLVDGVLEMFPPSAYLLMTAMSKQALFYMVEEESFAHRTIVIFERWGADVADYPIRTLQSEGRLIFWVPMKDPQTDRWVTTKIEKEGPTNFILTTTSPQLHPENETRQWTLIMDESPELTSSAKVEAAKKYEPHRQLDNNVISAWHLLHSELKALKVSIPYARWLAQHTPNKPLRMRRDFPKLLALIEVIALLHQYQRPLENNMLVAGLEDYFMARELVDQIFSASLGGINKKVKKLVSEVDRIYRNKLNAGDENAVVKPSDIALALETSSSSVSRWLRPAVEAGMVEVVSEMANGGIRSVKPTIGNSVSYSALPSIEEIAVAFPELAVAFRAVHPITGEEVTLQAEECAVVIKQSELET